MTLADFYAGQFREFAWLLVRVVGNLVQAAVLFVIIGLAVSAWNLRKGNS